MAKDFQKPLDQFVTEYQEIERNILDFDPTTGKVDIKQVKEKIPVKTIYTRAAKKRVSCPDGKHSWLMVDRHRHIAKCRQCAKHRFLRAAYETIRQGHIIDRATGQVID